MYSKEALPNQTEFELQKTLEKTKIDLGEDLPTTSELLNLEPSDELFMYGVEGYHGKNHAGRAVVLGSLLSRLIQKHNPSLQINHDVITYTLALHDTHRKEITDDPDHGVYAAMYYKNTTNLIPEDIKPEVIRLIQLHDIPTNKIRHDKQTPELHVVKDADKLERVRLNGGTITEAERLDPNRLHFNESKQMIPIARELFRRTKDKPESFTSIIDEAVKMGIVINK